MPAATAATAPAAPPPSARPELFTSDRRPSVLLSTLSRRSWFPRAFDVDGVAWAMTGAYDFEHAINGFVAEFEDGEGRTAWLAKSGRILSRGPRADAMRVAVRFTDGTVRG